VSPRSSEWSHALSWLDASDLADLRAEEEDLEDEMDEAGLCELDMLNDDEMHLLSGCTPERHRLRASPAAPGSGGSLAKMLRSPLDASSPIGKRRRLNVPPRTQQAKSRKGRRTPSPAPGSGASASAAGSGRLTPSSFTFRPPSRSGSRLSRGGSSAACETPPPTRLTMRIDTAGTAIAAAAAASRVKRSASPFEGTKRLHGFGSVEALRNINKMVNRRPPRQPRSGSRNSGAGTPVPTSAAASRCETPMSAATSEGGAMGAGGSTIVSFSDALAALKPEHGGSEGDGVKAVGPVRVRQFGAAGASTLMPCPAPLPTRPNGAAPAPAMEGGGSFGMTIGGGCQPGGVSFRMASTPPPLPKLPACYGATTTSSEAAATSDSASATKPAINFKVCKGSTSRPGTPNFSSAKLGGGLGGDGLNISTSFGRGAEQAP